MPVDTDLAQQGGPQTRPNQPSEGVLWPGDNNEGPAVAPTLPPQGPSNTGLPPGVHPNDQTSPESFQPGAEEPAPPVATQRAPFSTANGDAFGVNQRSAYKFRANLVVVNANQGGTSQVVGRLRGRKKITLWVPTQVVVGGALVTPPNGVMVSNTEGELQNGGGAYLGVGDSMTIDSEAAVAVGLIPGAAVGYVQYLDIYDAPGITGID